MTAPQATIRRIESGDAASFRSCLDAVARERRFLAMTEAPPEEKVRQFVTGSVQADSAQYVAIEDNQVVGWCDVFAHHLPTMQHVGTLGMGVLASHRGRGLGRALLQRTLAHALRQGIFRVQLEAREDNDHALRLYESVGFKHEARCAGALRFDGAFHASVKMALLTGPLTPAVPR